MIVTTPAIRIGIRYRVGLLGTLGIIGLVLVGCLYLFGQREQNVMENQASSAATTSMLMSRVLNDLTEACLFVVQFKLAGNEIQVGQEAVALESVARSLAEINALPGVSNTSRTGVELTAEAATVYGNRFNDLVELMRFRGFSAEDGLAVTTHPPPPDFGVSLSE